MGQIVGSNHLNEQEAVTALTQAALQIGLEDRETHLTIRSGLTAGKQEPRHPKTQIVGGDLDKKVIADADRIANRIRVGLLNILEDAEIEVDAITVNEERIRNMIGRSFWSASQSKLHFLNRDGHLVKFTQREGWKFILAIFGSPVGSENIIEPPPAKWSAPIVRKAED